jgi:4-aminobutyrate aminotransferase/(S)-3-amino-2-methylpropionate transaminase
MAPIEEGTEQKRRTGELGEAGEAGEWPGPKSRALLEARRRYVARGVSSATPLFVDSGHGAHLTDVDGREYLDFAAGIGTLAVGHAHPKVVEAVQRQAARFTHSCFSVAMYEPYVELARRLAGLTPGSFEKKAVLLNSGAEAVENAVKIARAATGRAAVVAFHNSFHGRTLLAMSLTGKVEPYRAGFGPFAPEVYLTPYPYPYRFPGTTDECVDAALHAVRNLFVTTVSPECVAAVVVEPVQGEGGFVVAPPRFLRELEQVCRQHGILLVADEIQTGFGRTGRMFAAEHSGIVPDLLLTAKSLASGMPLSGVVGRAEVMDGPAPGGLGGTYAGNPVACAAALAVLDVFEEEHLLDRAQAIGDAARARLEALRDRFDLIGEVRGIGPMLGIELVRDRLTKEPATSETASVLAACHRRGLIILRSGLFDNVIRLHIPLVTSEDDLGRGLDLLEEALQEVG